MHFFVQAEGPTGAISGSAASGTFRKCRDVGLESEMRTKAKRPPTALNLWFHALVAKRKPPLRRPPRETIARQTDASLQRCHALICVESGKSPEFSSPRAGRSPNLAKNRVRQNRNFMRYFSVIWVVQSYQQKYSACAVGQINATDSRVLCSQEGRFAIVTNVECGMRWTW
jgi:hypothetical protein